LKEVMK